jgi:hypothetical protein
LEKEGYVVPSSIPTAYVQGVPFSGPRSNGGTIEVGEALVVTMDDNGGVLNLSRVITSGGRATDGQGETKCEQTSSSHEDEDDTEEADLLSPSPLLLWSSDAASSEKSGRNAASDGKTIKEPQVLRTGAKGIQPTMVDGLYLSAVTRTCTGIWCSSPGTTVTWTGISDT